MTPKYTKIKFPLWQYLKQPVFSHDSKLVWNPHRFASIWRIRLLERCWTKECDAKGSQQH
ncbi:hypothetical protein Cylst_0520 [Cylindrospermum stagnale PCC 7417]|uniref:Uncharacterized protein n=1 Tax=Cylindrospermum stagnale PCC 7417 TaxID=56107 RepID=K9WSS5_9NOST|nr:hypothetical protein [Cylindrospermum stagnale]AFZ22859.1 hypothetical protein Cylst_0520 [Cylindrospermum stagnale PCC 7417]